MTDSFREFVIGKQQFIMHHFTNAGDTFQKSVAFTTKTGHSSLLKLEIKKDGPH